MQVMIGDEAQMGRGTSARVALEKRHSQSRDSYVCRIRSKEGRLFRLGPME